MNARTYTTDRAATLINAREEMRCIFRAGGMSDRELFDLLCFIGSQCAPEQSEWRDRISTITADMETDEPDADAYRGYLGPVTLDSRLERP